MKTLVNKTLLTLSLSLLSFFSIAQDLLYNIQFFDQEDGLIARDLRQVEQDDRGLIWIGTNYGLCRFDGVEFTRIKGKNNPLASGLIDDIYKSNDGKFWVQKAQGEVVHLDPINERILPIETQGQDIKQLTMIAPRYTSSRVLFMDENKQSYYLSKEGPIKPFLPKGIEPLYEINEGNYISTSEQEPASFINVNSKGERVDQHIYPSDKRFMVPLVFKDKKGYAQLGLSYKLAKGKYLKDLFLIEEDNKQVRTLEFTKDDQPLHIRDFYYTSSHTIYICLTRDSKGRFWLSLNNNLLLFDANGKLLRDLTPTIRSRTSVEFIINHLFIDNTDQCWVATGLGLFLINARENPFQNYLSSTGNESVRGIRELGDGQLLVGSYRGSKVLDIQSGKIIQHFSENIIGMSDLVNDTIWGGAHSKHHMFTFSNDSKTIEVKSFPPSIAYSVSTPFYDTTSNFVFSGTGKGLFYLDENRVRRPYPKLNDFQDLAYRRINHFKAGQKNIWLATSNGIYQLDREKGIVGHFEIPFKTIAHIYTKDEKIFWLATFGGGLIYWDRLNNLTKQYTIEDGLSDNVIYAVYKDAQEFLWLPSNNGLMRFDPKSGEVVIFQPEDGITHKEFNTYSHYQAEDGRLYFGGLNGITAFYPEEVSPVENNAPFIITQLEQFVSDSDSLVDKTSELLTEGKILLQPDDKFFTLRFALLDYADRENIYAWRINGLDDNWTYQTDNSIRINALHSGNYTLEVKAKGAGGQWAKEQLDISVSVLKPFYLKTQFIALAIALIALMSWFYFRMRTARLRKRTEDLSIEVYQRTQTIRAQNQQLQEAGQFKDKVLALVAHDLRSPLITLSGLTKKINYLLRKNRTEDIVKLSSAIDNSTANVTMLLDNIMNWALVQRGRFELTPKILNVDRLIDEVIQLYKDTADAKAIELLSTHSPLQLYADKNAIHTILRNLLNNAIKFTPEGGEISFNAFYQNKQTCIEIIDVGIGISPDNLEKLFDMDTAKRVKGTKGEKGTGFGLMLCKELVTLNQGTIEVESSLGKGTKFRVMLPTGNS